MSSKIEGLMKKTKKELAELVVNREEVIDNLKAAVTSAKNINENMKKDSDGYKVRINNLEISLKKAAEDLNKANEQVYQHQYGMDKIATEKAEIAELNNRLNKKIKSIRNFSVFLLLVIVVLIVLMAII